MIIFFMVLAILPFMVIFSLYEIYRLNRRIELLVDEMSSKTDCFEEFDEEFWSEFNK